MVKWQLVYSWLAQATLRCNSPQNSAAALSLRPLPPRKPWSTQLEPWCPHRQTLCRWGLPCPCSGSCGPIGTFPGPIGTVGCKPRAGTAIMSTAAIGTIYYVRNRWKVIDIGKQNENRQRGGIETLKGFATRKPGTNHRKPLWKPIVTPSFHRDSIHRGCLTIFPLTFQSTLGGPKRTPEIRLRLLTAYEVKSYKMLQDQAWVSHVPQRCLELSFTAKFLSHKRLMSCMASQNTGCKHAPWKWLGHLVQIHGTS